jgi:hypothetical protein
MTALLLNYPQPATKSVSDNRHEAGDMTVLIADDRRSRSFPIWASLNALRDIPQSALVRASKRCSDSPCTAHPR